MPARLTCLLALSVVSGCGRSTAPTPLARPKLEPQASGVTALLQAVSAPSEHVIWVSGHRATVLRSTDGGATWVVRPVTGADSGLQFRDVAAFDSVTAYVLAAGNGERSRIYKTVDGGTTWSLQFINQDSAAFYDCFAFWDARRGLAFSDAVQGHFVIRMTTDAGAHWRLVEEPTLPTAHPGEGAFAASGTCVVTLGSGAARIGTGAADTARLLATDDGGRTWRIAATPLTAGASAGIAALAFRDASHGLALGGDIGKPASRTDNVARTEDGGRTWRLAGRPAMAGAVYGAAVVPGTSGAIAVGPGGLDYSADDGDTWQRVDSASYWSVGFGPGRTGWAVGPQGRIVRIRF